MTSAASQLELIDLRTWCRQVAVTLRGDPPADSRPWPCFTDEYRPGREFTWTGAGGPIAPASLPRSGHHGSAKPGTARIARRTTASRRLDVTPDLDGARRRSCSRPR